MTVERTIEVAARVRGYVLTRFGEEPLNTVYAALLMVAAEIAHSQGVKNIDFRRQAREVYRVQLSAYQESTK